MEDPTAHQPADEAQPPADSSTQGDGGKEDPNRKKPNVRKRTKTGCLSKFPSSSRWVYSTFFRQSMRTQSDRLYYSMSEETYQV